MLGSIRGKVLEITGGCLLIETGSGLGYEVEAAGDVLSRVKKDEICFLYLHHVVREDSEILYGFSSADSRLLFRELIKVNGIGPKAAMSLLSRFDAQRLVSLLKASDVKTLSTAPGIGKKTAERLIAEMKDRLMRLNIVAAASEHVQEPDGSGDAGSQDEKILFCNEAISALMQLGFSERDCMDAVHQAYQEGLDTERIIGEALRILGKGAMR